MVECMSFTLNTLQSLLQLLDEVKNMVISDDIQQEVTMPTPLRNVLLYNIFLKFNMMEFFKCIKSYD